MFFFFFGGGGRVSFCPMKNWGVVSNCRHLRTVTCRTGSKSIWRTTHEIWREIVTSRKQFCFGKMSVFQVHVEC